MGWIYKITNNVNGKFYIGKTERGLKYRWRQHKTSSKSPRDYFHYSMRHHGVENFSIILLKEVGEDECINELEKHYIRWLKPQYNLKEGGEGGRHHPDAIERMRKPKTQEHKDNISKSRMGVKPHITPERNQKISKKLKGRPSPTKGTKWWNNGVESVCCKEQPEGFVRGRLPKHKRGLTPGLELGTKLNLTEEERKRRSNHLRQVRRNML